MSKTVNKSLKLRIYPTKEQEIIINKIIGSARFIYNFCRAKQKEKEKIWSLVNEMVQQGYFSENNYKTEYFNLNSMDKWITALKKDKNYEWLKEADKYALQNAVKDLDESYKKFYSKQGGKPRFRSKKNNSQSYRTTYNVSRSKSKKTGKETISENIWIKDNIIRLPKVGELKFKDMPFPKGKITNVTVKRSKSNKYYASVSFKCEIKEKNKTNKSVGIDLGIKEYLTLSDNATKDNPKFLKKEQDRIAELQKILSRKTSGSNNWWKAKTKLTRMHEKVASRRYDFIQKLTTELVTKYDIICIEDLDVKQMYQNSDIAKFLSDVPFYEFKRQLNYKCEWYGKTLSVVDKYFPSSQLCSCCGYKNKDVKDLNVREWICPKCNTHHNRDLNASINILNEGLRILNVNR